MVILDISIVNPLSDRWRILKNKHFNIAKNKILEMNAYETNTIVSLGVSLSAFTDHSGVRIQLGLLGFDVELHYYDTRHADVRWKK